MVIPILSYSIYSLSPAPTYFISNRFLYSVKTILLGNHTITMRTNTTLLYKEYMPGFVRMVRTLLFFGKLCYQGPLFPAHINFNPSMGVQ